MPPKRTVNGTFLHSSLRQDTSTHKCYPTYEGQYLWGIPRKYQSTFSGTYGPFVERGAHAKFMPHPLIESKKIFHPWRFRSYDDIPAWNIILHAYMMMRRWIICYGAIRPWNSDALVPGEDIPPHHPHADARGSMWQDHPVQPSIHSTCPVDLYMAFLLHPFKFYMLQ